MAVDSPASMLSESNDAPSFMEAPAYLPQCGFDSVTTFEELIAHNAFLFRVHTPHRPEALLSPAPVDSPYFLASKFRHGSTSSVALPPEPVAHTFASVSEHLNWTARARSPYISASFSFAWAVQDAARRYKLGVKQDVEIAVIDARHEALKRRAVVVTKVLDELQGPERTSKKYIAKYRSASDSQLVLIHGYIPRQAVYSSVPLRHLVPSLPSYFLIDGIDEDERDRRAKRNWPLGTSPTSLLYWTNERSDMSRPSRRRTMSLTINPRTAIHNSFALRSSSRPPLYSANSSPLNPRTAPPTVITFPRSPLGTDVSDFQMLCRTLSDRFMNLTFAERMQESTSGAVRSALCFLGPWLYEEILREDNRREPDETIAWKRQMRNVVMELAMMIARWPAPWWCGSVSSKIHSGIVDGIGIGMDGRTRETSEHPEVASVIESVIDVVVDFMNSKDGQFVRQLRELKQLGDALISPSGDEKSPTSSCKDCRRSSWHVSEASESSWDRWSDTGFGSETDAESIREQGIETEGSETDVELEEQQVESMLKLKSDSDLPMQLSTEVRLDRDAMSDQMGDESDEHDETSDDDTLVMGSVLFVEEDVACSKTGYFQGEQAIVGPSESTVNYSKVVHKDKPEVHDSCGFDAAILTIDASPDVEAQPVVEGGLSSLGMAGDLLTLVHPLTAELEVVVAEDGNDTPLATSSKYQLEDSLLSNDRSAESSDSEAGIWKLWKVARRWVEVHDVKLQHTNEVKFRSTDHSPPDVPLDGISGESEPDSGPQESSSSDSVDVPIQDATEPSVVDVDAQSEKHFRDLWESVSRHVEGRSNLATRSPSVADSDSEVLSPTTNAGGVPKLKMTATDQSLYKAFLNLPTPSSSSTTSSTSSTYSDRPFSPGPSKASTTPPHVYVDPASLATFGLTSFLCGVLFASFILLSVPRRELARFLN